jgi:hypothetical protein
MASNKTRAALLRSQHRRWKQQLLSDAAKKRGAIQAWAEASAIPLAPASSTDLPSAPPKQARFSRNAPMPSAASIFSLSSSSFIDDDDDGPDANERHGSSPTAETGETGRGHRVYNGRRQVSEMKRITVWIHAMAERRASRIVNDVFEAWVVWLVARVAPLQ